jgi:hypothetical protein
MLQLYLAEFQASIRSSSYIHLKNSIIAFVYTQFGDMLHACLYST